MNSFNESNLVIKRFLSEKIFDKFKDNLKELSNEIKDDRKLDIDADFWDMQFRKDDTITLYYKGCAFNFKLAVTDEIAFYKLCVSDALKKYFEGIMDENFLNKFIDIKEMSIGDFFKANNGKFKKIVNMAKFKDKEIERKRQQYITALFEADSDCIVIDYEVVVEKVIEEQCKITFNKECLIKNNEENKTFKELDLLVLKKNNNGKYEFIPVEIKINGNPGYRESICQVNAYTRILKNNIGDFIMCYQKVAQQKSKIGFINPEFKNLEVNNIEESISKSLVFVLYDNEISKRSKVIKNLEEISKNCNDKCEFENQLVKAHAVDLKSDNINYNDCENKNKIKSILIS